MSPRPCWFTKPHARPSRTPPRDTAPRRHTAAAPHHHRARRHAPCLVNHPWTTRPMQPRPQGCQATWTASLHRPRRSAPRTRGGVRILPPRNLAPLVYPSQVTPALAHVAQPQREFRRKPKRAPTTFAASRLMARAFALSRVKPAGNTWVAMTHYIAKQAYYLARKPLLSRQMQTSESR